MKFWQGIALYLFFMFSGVVLTPLLHLPGGAVSAVAVCLATLLLAAVFLAGNVPARRALLRVRQPLLGWSLVLALGLRMVSEVSVVLSRLFQTTRDISFLTGPLGFQLLYVVILAPITEETVIRGGLVTGLSRRLPWQAAVVISALIFAVGHSWFQAPQTIFVALVLGYLCWYTGSMVYGMVVHLFINSSAFVLPVALQHFPGGYTLGLSMGMVVAGLALTLWSMRRMLRCADAIDRFEARFGLTGS